ncbi:MAG: FGGY family carbohydrate kinase [Gammaproteobacteria bacterium]
MAKFYLSIDQGTTSSRAVLYNKTFEEVAHEQLEFKQYYPEEGLVEHNAEEIWSSVVKTTKALLLDNNVKSNEVIAIGITNQRETVLIWDKEGNVLGNAIVWQDRRTSAFCEKLKKEGLEEIISNKTGLLLDPYFSASKARWIIKEYDIDPKDYFFGTIDTFLVWKLTEGRSYKTDITNACRTSLLNIDSGTWDKDLIKAFDLSGLNFPEVSKNGTSFGSTKLFGGEIKITGMAGDQQASLIGQGCFSPGQIKSTYGTGCFLMSNTGKTRQNSSNKLLSTIAYQLDDICYALEGSIFMAGANFQWLRDKMNFFEDVAESEQLAKKANPKTNVFLIPAFVGLGAPHWVPEARGAIFGLTRDSGKEELSLATHEAVGFQTKEIISSLLNDGVSVNELRIDGGLTNNIFFNQLLSNITQLKVSSSKTTESTALGAAYLAAIGSGEVSLNDIIDNWLPKASYTPDESYDIERYDTWKNYLEKLISQ